MVLTSETVGFSVVVTLCQSLLLVTGLVEHFKMGLFSSESHL